jgi:phosphohistidine phosphatase
VIRKMKTLILVRHGDFQHKDPFVPDIGRPMTRKGRRDLHAVAGRFAALNIVPDLIVTSPARRTGETAEIFGKKAGLSRDQMKVNEDLFEAEKREILRIVHALDDSLDTVMLVGHDPAMTSLLHHLVNAEVYNLKFASFAVLNITGRWRDAAFGRAELVHLDVPKPEPVKIGWKERLACWKRERIQKIEIFSVFMFCLLLILAVVAAMIYFGARKAAGG